VREREAERKTERVEKKTLGSSAYISPVRIVWAAVFMGLLVLSLLTEAGLISGPSLKMVVFFGGEQFIRPASVNRF
jgi:hypothetical protein